MSRRIGVTALCIAGCGLLLFGVACIGTGRGAAAARFGEGGGTDRNIALQIAGTERLYRVHMPPAYDGKRPVPLVLVFHAEGDSPERIARVTNFNALSDEKGFLVIYPQANTGYWNDGRSTAGAATEDDVAFVSKLIDRASMLFAVDPQRVYAAGFSNGGMMVQRLAAELPDKIAAAAAVAGPLPRDLAERFNPRQPVSVLMVHGTADMQVPYGGGQVRGPVGGQVLSVAESVDRWLAANGCTNRKPTSATLDPDTADGRRIRRETYSACRQGTAVEIYTIEGGDHSWPGGAQPGRFGRLVEPTSRDVDATRAIWEFFEGHARM